MSKLPWGLLALSAGLLTACQGEQPVPETDRTGGKRVGSIDFHACTLDSGRDGKGVPAQCGTLDVPEDPSQPQGRRIALNIAWLGPDEGRQSEPDPVFFLAGGPGQAATEVAAAVVPALNKISKQRDLFFIDQRGTGQSNPLDCRDAAGKALELEVDGSQGSAEQLAYATACLAGLEGRADPRFYTTSHAIDDLEAVRQALGMAKVNLIGGSYGTRVAQQYAARYPEQTRSLVLDGVVPNDLVVGAEFAQTFQRAIEAQSALCQADPACAKRFPTDTVTQLRQVVAELERSPRTVQYRDPSTAEWHDESLPAMAVTGLAFAFSYVPEMASLLPVVIDEAAHGRYQGLASLARLAGQSMAGSINRGMQWSVICSEDADRKDSVAAADASTLLGPETVEMFYAACAVWPQGEPGKDFTRPLTTSVPTLLLSGEFDPVTPPTYGTRVAEGLPKGRHLVVRGRGHGTLSAGCMPDLLGQFVERADADSLDASCLDTLRPVPPFTTFNGWEP